MVKDYQRKEITTTTTIEIGRLCQQAQARGDRVFVHRCGWGDACPIICCSAAIIGVDSIDKHESLVRFGEQQVLDISPLVSPQAGQSFYFAAACYCRF